MAGSPPAGDFEPMLFVHARWLWLAVCAGCFHPSFDGAPPCSRDADCAYLQVCDLEYNACRIDPNEMREVAGATFTMGCVGGTTEPGCDSDEAAHQITLSSYWIDTV